MVGGDLTLPSEKYNVVEDLLLFPSHVLPDDISSLVSCEYELGDDEVLL